jgi:DNA replication protein DnaC
MSSNPKLFNIEGMDQKITPAARVSLRNLDPKTPALLGYLESLQDPKPLTEENFLNGVEQFVGIVNHREDYFPSPYHGLHMAPYFFELWNKNHPTEQVQSNESFLFNVYPLRIWTRRSQGGPLTYQYRGSAPSSALDALLHGPAAIDCGMFCQLALWFGLRYVLGNEAFDRLFGRIPFHLTQLLYQPLVSSVSPFAGNPLFSFMQETSLRGSPLSGLDIVHIPNLEEYIFKHPAGTSQGENTLIFPNGNHVIFGEICSSRTEVEERLRQAFNAPQDESDLLRIQRREKEHDSTAFLSRSLENAVCESREKFVTRKKSRSPTPFTFDFSRFLAWKASMESPRIPSAYVFLTPEEQRVDPVLLDTIPYENKHEMQFSRFEVTSPLQERLVQIAKDFCQAVMDEKSCWEVLTGQPGIGKTATAVCIAKELSSRGKKVFWASEMAFSRISVSSMEDFLKALSQIKQMIIESNPDVVILDDDNLAGSVGVKLLEVVYTWYVEREGRHVLVTSNTPINFELCFGLNLDGSEEPFPFVSYDSSRYLSMRAEPKLSGESYRIKRSVDLSALSQAEKFNAFFHAKPSHSLGIICSRENFDEKRLALSGLVFIPSFKIALVSRIQEELYEKGTLGPSYDELDDDQKAWSHKKWGDNSKASPPQASRWLFSDRWFEQVKFECIPQVIGVECSDEDFIAFRGYRTKKQLVAVLNYAHDKGGIKVLIVNHSSYSDDELLPRICQLISKDGWSDTLSPEAQRTVSRLDALLKSKELQEMADRLSRGEVPAPSDEPFIPLLKPLVLDKVRPLCAPRLFSGSITREESGDGAEKPSGGAGTASKPDSRQIRYGAYNLVFAPIPPGRPRPEFDHTFSSELEEPD